MIIEYSTAIADASTQHKGALLQVKKMKKNKKASA